MTKRRASRWSSGRTGGLVLVLAALSGIAAAAALGDSTPPPSTTVVVTVTTPVTAPTPDPAPTTSTPKPTPTPKHHVTPKPKPASTAPAVNAVSPNTTQPPAFRPPTVTRPRTHARVHAKKPRVHAAQRHKAKKPASKKRPTVQPVAPVVPTTATTGASKRTASRPAAGQGGGIASGLTLTLFSIVAVVLLAIAAAFELRRRRVRANWEFGGEEELPVFSPLVLPVPPQSRAIAAEPVALIAPVVEPEETVAMPVAAEVDEAPVADDFVEVTAWRGYTKWRFYARLYTGDGEAALIESRPFRAPGSAAPEATQAAEAAYAELTARLQSEGWLRVERGERWFESTFVQGPEEDSTPPIPERPAADPHQVLERDAVT